MEHIDEGTIHAWLDGALPADESARVEAHVTSCTACAAAVAEARGLIAASSRILSALDDVPGGVIPVAVVTAESVTAHEAASSTSDASTATSGTATSGAETASGREVVARASASGAARSTRRARRPWYLRPQWAAAAGITFLAVAATTVWQRSGRPGVMDTASERAATAPMAAEFPMAAEPASAKAADSAAPSASRVTATDAPGAGGAASPAAMSERDDSKERARAPNSTESKKDASGGAALDAARRELPVVASKAIAANEASARAIPVPAAPPPAIAADESRAKRVGDSTGANRVLALSAKAITQRDSARLAGELRLGRAADNLSLQQVTVTGASSSAAPAAQRSQGAARPTAAAAPPATPAALAGCYLVQPADAARAAGLGELLQLEFAGAGSDESRPAYAARSLGVASVQPTAALSLLRWTLSTSGDVVVVRGEGASAERVTLRIGSSSADSLAAGQLRATRTTCPVR